MNRDVLLHQFWPPAHGGHPGEIVVQDEYLECPACGWSYPLEQGDEYCEECEMGALLEVRRAHPAPQATLRLALDDGVGVCPAGHGSCPCRHGSTSHAHCLAERRAA